MRLCVILTLIFWLSACDPAEPPTLSQIEIMAPGLEIEIDGRGNGRFRQTSGDRRGRFLLSADQLSELRNRTEPFRRSRDARSSSEMQALVLKNHCDGHYVTDQGGITIRWIGPSIDQFYSIDYGCDPERHVARNAELRALLAVLPVPEPDILP
jgi:hypothetical protein